jgi:hypothetical protein
MRDARTRHSIVFFGRYMTMRNLSKGARIAYHRGALSVPPPSVLSVMQRYMVTGIEHIFLGHDYIAFVIAIVLWARRLLPVIKIDLDASPYRISRRRR